MLFVRMVTCGLAIAIIAVLVSCSQHIYHNAILNSDVQRISNLLASGHSPDEVVFDGYTATQLAVMYEKPTVLKLLLDKGGDVNLVSADRKGTLLSLSCWNKTREVLRILLDNHADVNLRMSNGACAIHSYAAMNDEEGVGILIDAGADPNVADDQGWTPLHYAAGNGNETMIKLLLDNGADPRKELVHGSNAIEIAKTNGYPLIAELMETFVSQ